MFATRGGYYEGTPRDTQTAYVRDFFAFLGMTDVEFVYAEGMAFAAEQGLASARTRISELLVA